MKRLNTILPFDAYRDLANSTKGFDGDKDFIDLLVPALAEVSNEVIETFISLEIGVTFTFTKPHKYKAIEVAIIREYVKRVLNHEREEWEARRRLAELRQNLQNDPAYTEIRPKDASDIADEDRYARYTVQDFQDEIDFLTKRSLEAQLNGDIEVSGMLSYQASKLTERQMRLKMRTESFRKAWDKWGTF